MKKVIALIAVCFLQLTMHSKCASGAFEIWPNTQEVKLNSVFILTGYGNCQDVILKLNKKYPVYLSSKNGHIKLKVKEILVGQFQLTQAVLVPETKLLPNSIYKLVVDSLSETEAKEWKAAKKAEEVSYVTGSETDTEAPRWVEKPAQTGKSYQMLGCGPEEYVKFSYKTQDASELICKAHVKDLKSGKVHSFYVTGGNKEINIGHGMCSGAFTFNAGKHYELKMDLMDASGNHLDWSDKAITFNKP